MTTLEDLQVGLGLAAAEVLALMRSEPDVDALTPGGEWTVRDTAVHLICVPRMYTRLLNGQPAPFGSLLELAGVERRNLSGPGRGPSDRPGGPRR